MSIPQSTAATIIFGPFIDETDAKTPLTSLTFAQADIQISMNGGSPSQTSNATPSFLHQANMPGCYSIDLTVTDTSSTGRMRVWVNTTGSLPVYCDFMVIPQAVYNHDVGGSVTTISVDTASFSGSAATSITGLPASISSDTTTIVDAAHTTTKADAITNTGTVTAAIAALNNISATDVAGVATGSVAGSMGQVLNLIANATDNESPVHTGVVAIQAKTDTIPANPAAVDSEMGLNAAAVAAVGAEILHNPAFKILGDAEGKVTTSNPVSGGSAVTEASVAAAVATAVMADTNAKLSNTDVSALTTTANQIKTQTDKIVDGGATAANVTAVGDAVIIVDGKITALNDFDPDTHRVDLKNIDGKDWEIMLAKVSALVGGNVTKAGDTYTANRLDGVTPLGTVTTTSVKGVRTGTVI